MSEKSLIDDVLDVSENQWVVSIVCKPTGKNREHAILLVEGLKISGEEKTYHLRRYDFFTESERGGSINKILQSVGFDSLQSYQGVVVTKESYCEFSDRHNYFWGIMMKDISREAGCRGLSWPILSDDAEKLSQNIHRDRANPPDYHVTGDSSSFQSLSNNPSHNCYTWARSKLRELNVRQINDDRNLDSTISDFLASRTTRHLRTDVDLNVDDRSSSFCRLS